MSDPPEPGGGPHPAAPRRAPDPLGKRALFTRPDAPVPDATPPAGSGAGATGRRTLFSGPQLGPRSVIVECRRCGHRSPVSALALALQLVPSFWRPANRYSRYMRCPACGRFAWCRIDWSVFRPT